MEEFKRKLLHIENDNQGEDIVKGSGISLKMFEESMEMLHDWYLKQPHMPNEYYDKDYMMRFFGLNKFSLERTKTKLDTLLGARTLIPEILGNRDLNDEKLIKALKNMEYFVMPDKTPNNERIHLARLTSPNPDDYDPLMAYKVVFLLADVRLKTDNNLEGDIIVWDCTNYKMGHIVKTTPMMVKKMVFILEGCYSASVKGLHFINCPSYAMNLLNLIKSCVKAKLAQRIFIHAKVEDLYQHMPRDIMPKDLGGGYSMTRTQIADAWFNNLQSNEWKDWLKEVDKCKSDLSKRPKDNKNGSLEDQLGIEGTFRRLDID